MFKYSDIKSVHIEPTQKCQAACLQCDRNLNGGEDNPYLTGAELKYRDFKKIFSKEFIGQLNHMYMCGNLGDPCISVDGIYCYDYFRKINSEIYLSMNTNGGAKATDWWKWFGRLICCKLFN